MKNVNLPLVDSPSGEKLVREECEALGIEPSLLSELVSLEMDQVGRQRRRGFADRLDEILDQVSER